MISDDQLLDLPDDPELAFVEYERALRDKLQSSLDHAEGHYVDDLYLEYINHVIAGAKALHLDFLNDERVPTSGEYTYQHYKELVHRVDHYTVQVRFRNSRRIRQYSVALDPAAKAKIRHYLTKVREVVEKLEISARKREAIFSKIAALELEVDRERTRFEAAMALILEAAETGATAAQRLKPVKDLIDSVTDLIRAAKDKEEANTPRLPPPAERKRIEPPSKSASTEKDIKSLTDDDIPF